ncbi:MAG: exosortase/archaeosortase family protein [Acidobacteriota bacterium]|nr:exosortase/archaeosortase family protein [Acidobacteriota bacterium]
MASAVDHLSEQRTVPQARPIPWVTLAWFGVLLILAYLPVMIHLVEQWSTDEDVGHGFFVIPVTAFIAWQRREQIMALRYQPAWWGLGVMVWAALQGYVGTLGAELFLQRTSLLLALVGLLLVTGGTKLVRELAFPLLLLPFMIPIPSVIYNQITFPLQLFASQVAEFNLGLVGIPVLRDGNILELASQKLSVVEACSGIRSLLSLSFLSLVYAYFFDKRVWMRWVLLAATIPVAIVANAGRVTITGVLSEINPELARGFFHSLEGWIIFIIALVLLGGLHLLICRVTRKHSLEDPVA